MKRRGFIAGSVAVGLCTQPSLAQSVPVSDLVAEIPGVTGIYARALSDEPALISEHADEMFAAASIIKLAILVAVYRAFDSGHKSPNDKATIHAADIIGGSPIFGSADPGEMYYLHTLVRAMIHQSDNTASNTLITALGLNAINAALRECGLSRTRLGSRFADVVPASYISANVTTPRDIGQLLYAIERGSREHIATVASATSCRMMIDLLLGQEDKSKIPSGLPPSTPCANKTGEVDRVRNDAAIVDPYGGKPFILVVLTRELDDVGAGDRGIAQIARRVNAAVRL